MSRKATGFGLAVLLAAGVLFAYTGWNMRTSAASACCGLCGCTLHGRDRTAGVTGEHTTKAFCRPTCAWRASLEGAEASRSVELTDYLTGNRLAPPGACLVRGSNINVCPRKLVVTDQFKDAAVIDFDHCSPSISAFSHPGIVEAFQDAHGGQLLRYEDLTPRAVLGRDEGPGNEFS